jgi:hypothetical protein
VSKLPDDESGEIPDRRRSILKSIVEGRKLDAYAEYRTKDMRSCWICQEICYKKPVKVIGTKSICIDCLRQLKEAIEGLEQWEKELTLEEEVKKKLDHGVGV